MARCSAIFFDFDGVLVESLDVKVEAFRRLYAPHGKSIQEQALDHYISNTGVPRIHRFRHCHERFLGVSLSDDEAEALSDQFGHMVEDAVVACAWVAGAREFLEAHAERQPCFVVSATPREELERILHRRQMRHFFAAAYGSPPEKTEILETVLRTRELNPRDTIMIGDGLADYRAAQANGMRFLGRTHAGWRNPFPDGTETVEDLCNLERWAQLS